MCCGEAKMNDSGALCTLCKRMQITHILFPAPNVALDKDPSILLRPINVGHGGGTTMT